MADEQPAAGAAAAEQATPPAVSILAQYVKDLSFENPRAPMSLQPQENPPAINVDVKVSARGLGQDNFEVGLNLTAKAGESDAMMFNVELIYAGVFRVQNVPKEHMHPFLMIECPRLLFPFARQIVSDATRHGGFAPLMIDPVDFSQIYRRDMEARAAQQKAQNGAAEEETAKDDAEE